MLSEPGSQCRVQSRKPTDHRKNCWYDDSARTGKSDRVGKESQHGNTINARTQDIVVLCLLGFSHTQFQEEKMRIAAALLLATMILVPGTMFSAPPQRDVPRAVNEARHK